MRNIHHLSGRGNALHSSICKQSKRRRQRLLKVIASISVASIKGGFGVAVVMRLPREVVTGSLFLELSECADARRAWLHGYDYAWQLAEARSSRVAVFIEDASKPARSAA